MAMNNKAVREALKLQPLSEEEKKQRHILGRLYGPIATCNEGTRNGRKYNYELWKKALEDPLFEEKLKTKSLFLELGHPVNREETDMEKVCACIPEMPKIVDGELYAYIDILDTNNGRLLKTLCDYGFVPGISSRGSGDVDDYTKEVDPETFFLETWDIVQLPAVKSARLKMCEGLDTTSLKLKKALNESYEHATSKEREAMKESLENLNIDADLEEDIDEIPWSENPDNLVDECLNEDADTDEVPAELAIENELPVDDSEEDSESAEPIEDEVPETEDELPEDETPEEDSEELSLSSVGELIDSLSSYDDSFVVEFAPITIDGKEYSVDSLELDDSEDGKLVINLDCLQETGDDIAVDDEAEEVEAEASVEEIPEEPEDDSEEADDVGTEEVLESLKESIRQKDALEKQVKQLKSAKTVSDAEVKSLKEELDRYKSAFIRMGEIAAKAEDYEAEISQLNEQLNQRSCEVESLKAKYSTKLTESTDKTKQQLQSLKEQLITARTERDEAEERLTEQVNAYKKKLKERNDTVIKYRDTCNETVNHYISYRASMLGVKPAEIINRLDENYSINDIDTVCDKILTETASVNKLPYGFNRDSKVRINESKAPRTSTAAYSGGYEVDDDLLELAGLK